MNDGISLSLVWGLFLLVAAPVSGPPNALAAI